MTQPNQQDDSWYLIPAILAFFLYFISAVVFVPLDSPGVTPCLLVAFSGLCALSVVRCLIRRRIDFFEIIYPVSLSYFIYFVLGPRDPLPETGLTFPWLTDLHLNRAMAYVGLGYCGVLLGYYGPLRNTVLRKLPRLSLEADPTKTYLAIYILYGVGTAVRLLMLAYGSGTLSTKVEEFEYGSKVPVYFGNLGYFSSLGLLGYLMAVCCYCSPLRTRVLGLSLWLMMFPAECFWVFLQGSKSLMIPIVASPWIAYNYLRRKVSVWQILVPAMLFVFLVFPVITAYRTFVSDYPIQLSTLHRDLPKIAGLIAKEMTHPDSEGYVGNAPIMVTERASGLLPVANTLQYVENEGLLNGKTLREVFLVVIPSFLNPGKYKALEETGLLYGEEIFGMEALHSGVSIMQVGEFYLNFGLLGILIGMFLQGLLYRCWQDYWIEIGTPLALAVFILGWRWLTFIEVPFSVGYGLFLRDLLLMIPIVWFVSRKKTAP